MRLCKVDLSSLVAIAHSKRYLQLLLDRGDEAEFLEIPALPFKEEPIAMLPGYDRDEQILQVEFQNGAVCRYLGVDEDTWKDLHSLKS
jgi:KTSC domain